MSRLWEIMSDFPAGRVPLLVLGAVLVSGTVVASRVANPEERPFQIWTFTNLAADEFSRQLKTYPGNERIKLQNLGRAMTERLALAIMSQEELPNLVEVEQSEFGQYLRGPAGDIPFVDLSDRLKREGWYDRFVTSRFAKYSAHGRIYGIPHDLHPAELVYRPDLLEALGYTPDNLTTWHDWMAAAKDFHRAGPQGTTQWRYGLVFSDVECYDFLMLLWQRGGDVFSSSGEVIIDDDLAIDTLERYVAMFRDDPPAVGPKLSGWNEDFAALARGQIIAYPAVDWLLATMRLEAEASLSGKVRCMPLPAWDRGGRRTSTSGGTMMGIPKGCPDVEEAWRIAKHLYFDDAALVARFRRQTIIPPLHSVFGDPVFDEPVPFFQGQRVGRLLTDLAVQIPAVQGSPYSPNAYVLLNAVFSDIIQQRTTPRAALEDVARQLRKTVARDRFAIEAAGR